MITATVLIIGFMLAGVLADHKESERLPGQLTSQLETYLYCLEGMIEVNGSADAQELIDQYYRTVSTIEHYLLNGGPVDACYDAISRLNVVAAGSKSTQGSGVSNFNKIAAESLPKIRETIGRIDTIRFTGFLPAGYALLRSMVVVALGLLIFADVKSSAAEYFIVGVVALVMIVLIRLIADLDDPFDYTDGTYAPGSNEINPYALVDFKARVAQKLNVAVAQPM